jgi:S-adenosylmethionine/arginine decarboxylase-like enzyme
MDFSMLNISHLVGVIKLKQFPDSETEFRQIADELTQKLGLTVVNKNSYAYTPIGHTLVYILSQSHIAFHTWPEYNMIHIDLVSCKMIDEEIFKQSITECYDKHVVEEMTINKLSY